MSKKTYQEAFDIAKENLPPYHSIRLNLAINFSVFYCEIMNAQDKACTIAKTAIDNAIGIMNEDSTLIMLLLKTNLNIWKTQGSLDDQDVDEPGPSN